jgi:hypothetical protein
MTGAHTGSPAFAGTTVDVCRHNSAISPHVLREVCHQRAPPSIRGHGECRAPDAPAASCAHGVASMHTSIHSESPEITRHSPRNGLRLIPALSPVIGFFATVASRVASTDLTPASGCQDHTSSPSALASPVKRAVASTAARPASVTFAKRPSEWDGMAVNVFLIFRIVKRNILRDRRTRRITLNPLGKLVFAHSGFSDQNFCAERPIHSRINPSGKSVDDSDVPRLSPCRPAERPDPTPGVRDQRRISNGYERREPLNSEWSATSASVRIPDSSRTPHKGPKSAQSRSLPRLEKRRSGHFQPELSATRSQ